MKKPLYFLLGLLLLTMACKKEDTNPVDEQPEYVQAGVNGIIFNEFGNPLNNALVTYGDKTAKTDARGYFLIRDAKVRSAQEVVRAEKSGYFAGFRTMVPQAGADGFVKIQLLSLTVQASLDAQAGGEAVADGGKVQLQFPANAVVDSDGNPYNGIFDVAIQRIDPTASNYFDIMPGNLTAETADGDFSQLKSFGMVGVELTGNAGQPLQIAPGKTVAWTQEIPSGLLNEAPSSIALWYFDEESGLWQEEGTANKQGANYVGEISHFSYWNLDISIPQILLTIPFAWKGGLPLPAYKFNLSISDPNFVLASFLADNGMFMGPVPADKTMTIELFDPCNELIYAGNFGPFSENTTLSTVFIDPGALDGLIYSFQGQITDCNGSPLQNGYLYLTTTNSAHYLAISGGQVENPTIYVCEATGPGTAVAYDLDNFTESAPVSINFDAGITIDLGTVNVCTEAEYLQFYLDGIETNIVNANVLAFGNGPATVQGFGGGGQGGYIVFENYNPGFSDLLSLQLNGISSNGTPDITLEITQSGGLGEVIQGNFSGSFLDIDAQAHSVTGTFFAIRDF